MPGVEEDDAAIYSEALVRQRHWPLWFLIVRANLPGCGFLPAAAEVVLQWTLCFAAGPPWLLCSSKTCSSTPARPWKPKCAGALHHWVAQMHLATFIHVPFSPHVGDLVSPGWPVKGCLPVQGAALGGVGSATGSPAPGPRQALGRRLAFAGLHSFLVGGFLMLELFPGELPVQVFPL